MARQDNGQSGYESRPDPLCLDQLAKEEQQRADEANHRAAILAERLRALGQDPDDR